MRSGTIAVVGRPNSGKSTLVNALVGEKISIVSDKPQTTRHRILGIVHDPRGQAVFVDTPGIHKPGYVMNRRMLRVVSDALREVDLVVLVVDCSIRFGAGEQFTLDMVRSAKAPALLALNKTDRVAKPRLLPVIDRYSRAHTFLDIVPISALTGDNVPRLLDCIFAALPEGAPVYDADSVTDRSERFLVAERIREKVLERTREELPYATAVVVHRFDESDRGNKNKKLVRIEADILVEKSSQAGIIVGRRGEALRDVGIAARRDIEQLLGCRVYLHLQVKTAEKWRDDEAVLEALDLH